MPVNYVVPGTALQKGELLTTSGLQGAKYPPDIPVARIASTPVSTPSSTQEVVSAVPIADLAAIQYVDVMLWQPSQPG